jgi:hypothetical protein
VVDVEPISRYAERVQAVTLGGEVLAVGGDPDVADLGPVISSVCAGWPPVTGTTHRTSLMGRTDLQLLVRDHREDPGVVFWDVRLGLPGSLASESVRWSSLGRCRSVASGWPQVRSPVVSTVTFLGGWSSGPKLSAGVFVEAIE